MPFLKHIMSLTMGMLTVSLDAIVANWRTLQSQVGKSVAVSAVIKANAYGLGALRVAPILYDAGCRHFFFATLAEAIAARPSIPLQARCYVFHGVPKNEEALFAEHYLIPVLSSVAAIEQWANWRNKSAENALPCVIKFDTGMTRLGVSASELESLCREGSCLVKANPVMLMSHLACSDEAQHPQNAVQLKVFQKVSNVFRELFPNAKLSLANSGGIFLGREYHQNLVRPGAALYGLHPTVNMNSPIRAVVSLALEVIQLRAISQSVSVGYGATAQANAGQVLAVASGGYADGLHRLLSVKGEGVCCGVRVPVVGRISMDATTFDVTSVPNIKDYLHQSVVELPLMIEVVNDALNLSFISNRNGNLGYEVLTSLASGRYERRYISSSGEGNGSAE